MKHRERNCRIKRDISSFPVLSSQNITKRQILKSIITETTIVLAFLSRIRRQILTKSRALFICDHKIAHK